MSENKLKAMLERGERPTQAAVMSGDLIVAHAVARMGADSVWIDLQHGPATIDRLCELVIAVGHENCPFVRVPSMEGGVLEKAVVDAGVAGVICPFVNTAEEAAELVETCNEGAAIRARSMVGYGGASDECLAVAQIESRAGFENLEAICATPGLFALLPGPTDLSVAFGGPALGDYTDEVQAERLRHIVEVAHAHGVYVALPARDREQFDLTLDFGTDYTIIPGFDMTWMRQGFQASLAMVNEALRDRAGTASAS
jgi:4-hydroxy-2-oxoheptanedioate aldolase